MGLFYQISQQVFIVCGVSSQRNAEWPNARTSDQRVHYGQQVPYRKRIDYVEKYFLKHFKQLLDYFRLDLFVVEVQVALNREN